MSSCSISFLLLSAAVVATRAAQPGCTDSSLCASHEATIQVGGVMREYVVVTPPAPVGTFAALIVGIHGWTQEDGWACQAMAQPYVTSLNVIFMCPQGAQGTGGKNTYTGWNTWDAAYGDLAEYNNDDVAFIRAATTQVLSEYSFEGNTAYAIGFSFGGDMTFRLACDASDLFSGFGVVGERGPYLSATTQSYQPWSSGCATVPTKRPLFMAIGDQDVFYTATDVMTSFENYATSVLGCAGPSTPTQVAQDVTCHRYTACGDLPQSNLPQSSDDAEICIYAGMNHVYPTVADAPQAEFGFPIAPSAAIGAQWPATPNAWALWRGKAQTSAALSPPPSTPSTPTPDTGEKDDDKNPCFPSTAMVTKADGTRVAVISLMEGDAIVSATADGKLTTDTVSLLSIAKPEESATFVTLFTTVSGRNLTLTPEHHLPVGESCCANLKQAKDVEVGDTVWAVEAGTVTTSTVKKIASTSNKGLHSPVLTNGGFPVVDNFVTSFDSFAKVTIASYLLKYAVQGCKATGTCDALRGTFMKQF